MKLHGWNFGFGRKMDTRGVKKKLDLGFLAEGREDRIILGFILNLEEDIEGFNSWNFEWKMETRRVGKFKFSEKQRG